jgi:hypothetical protein
MSSVDSKGVLKLAVFIIAISMLYFFGITFVPLPESGEDNAKYISGFLVGTGLASIIGYYWGGAAKKPGGPDEPKPEVKP